MPYQGDLTAAVSAAEDYRTAAVAAEAALVARDNAIREAYACGASLAVIGEALGLSKPNISRIVNQN